MTKSKSSKTLMQLNKELRDASITKLKVDLAPTGFRSPARVVSVLVKLYVHDTVYFGAADVLEDAINMALNARRLQLGLRVTPY